MSKHELLSKFFSRLSFIEGAEEEALAKAEGREPKYTRKDAKATRAFLRGNHWSEYSDRERSLMRTAIGRYSEYARRIHIREGVGNIKADDIRREIALFAKAGIKPVVIIDYVQIIAPSEPRATDKQSTDFNVTALKRISRDFRLPVIGISSLNRENYSAPINLAAFKESGGIEYSSDALIGLQYAGIDEVADAEDNEKKSAKIIKKAPGVAEEMVKAGKPLKIQAKVLKQRNGERGSAYMLYYPVFNYFEHVDKNKGETVFKYMNAGGELDWNDYLDDNDSRPSNGGKGKSKRQKQREEFEAAFEKVPLTEGKAKLKDLADRLDFSQTKVKNLIKDLGDFEVIKDDKEENLVVRKSEPEGAGDAEELPF